MTSAIIFRPLIFLYENLEALADDVTSHQHPEALPRAAFVTRGARSWHPARGGVGTLATDLRSLGTLVIFAIHHFELDTFHASTVFACASKREKVSRNA
jgi:hypothetical protein